MHLYDHFSGLVGTHPNMVAKKVENAAKSDVQQFALGLALTNECNLTCSFCYRDPDRVDRLTLDQVEAVMKRLPIRSVNLGTGENGMHPDRSEERRVGKEWRT